MQLVVVLVEVQKELKLILQEVVLNQHKIQIGHLADFLIMETMVEQVPHQVHIQQQVAVVLAVLHLLLVLGLVLVVWVDLDNHFLVLNIL